MVFASSPVLSDNRFDARPVGAQSATRTCLAIRIFRIELTRVVLPTPGPPVLVGEHRAEVCEVDLCRARGRRREAHLEGRRLDRPDVAQEVSENAVAAGVAEVAQLAVQTG